MQSLLPLALIMTFTLHTFAFNSETETNFEVLPSHLIIMTKEEIEKKLTELPPNAEHHILYFDFESTKLTTDSENIIPKVLKGTEHKLPSMINIITSHDKNESFDLALERLERIDSLLSQKGFKHQHQNEKLDRNEMFLFLVSTCCMKKQQSTVVLVKNKKEENSILIQNKKGELTLDKPSATVDITNPNELPNSFRVMSQTEFDLRFGAVNNALPDATKTFMLFFKPQSTSLTEASKEELSSIISTINNHMPCVVDIIGHTDTVGSKPYNLKLGLKRAKAIGQLLEAQGINKKHLKLKSYGEEVLFIQTTDNVNEPRNQNVEIFIK